MATEKEGWLAMLEKLLKPDTVAVIGASRSPGKVGHEILANLINAGFQGTIVPVNPTADTILDLPCFPSLQVYGKPIDLSVIAVPRGSVRVAVDESLAAGAGAICIITAGFKEVGEEGAKLEREIAEVCTAHHARLLGPNCLGLINTHHRMNASFAKQMPRQGGISVISQSGALCTAILDWAAERHIGLSKLISIGNKADLDECDLVAALAADDETRVIVAYLESIASGKRVHSDGGRGGGLEAGGGAQGRNQRRRGQGRLVPHRQPRRGRHRLRGGVPPLRHPPRGHLRVALRLRHRPGDAAAAQGQPRRDHHQRRRAGHHGRRRGGELRDAGGRIELATAAALREKLPAAASVGNPIDVLGDADPERYGEALDAAQDDDSVDAIIVLLTPQAMTRPADTARTIARRLRGTKPVLASFMGGLDVMPGREELVECRLPDYPSPERAVAALKAMVDYAEWRQMPPRVVARFPVNRRRVERILHRCARTGEWQVGEAAAKDIMRAYDFNVPEGRIVTNVEEAIDAAVKIGFPVAMKIVSPDIVHKSDLGGVKLNLATSEAVRDAFDLMMLRIRAACRRRESTASTSRRCVRGAAR